MNSHHTDPEDVDATFAAIVADLRAEGVGEITADLTGEAPEASAPAEPETGWRAGGTSWDETMLSDDPPEDTEHPEDTDHYVPRDPPPLPRPGKGAIVVLLFFLIGLLLLIAPGLIGVSASLGTPLGILALAIAIALSLLRVKQGPPDGADPTNGAQI